MISRGCDPNNTVNEASSEYLWGSRGDRGEFRCGSRGPLELSLACLQGLSQFSIQAPRTMLRWKPEQLISLVAAIFVGATLGFLIGFTQRPSWILNLADWVNSDEGLTWTAIGALIVGGDVFAWILFSNAGTKA